MSLSDARPASCDGIDAMSAIRGVLAKERSEVVD